MPPGRKLGAPLVVERPWSPSMADQLACRPSDFVARLPLSIGVLGSLGPPIAPDFLVVVPAPMPVAAFWPSVHPIWLFYAHQLSRLSFCRQFFSNTALASSRGGSLLLLLLRHSLLQERSYTTHLLSGQGDFPRLGTFSALRLCKVEWDKALRVASLSWLLL